MFKNLILFFKIEREKIRQFFVITLLIVWVFSSAYGVVILIFNPLNEYISTKEQRRFFVENHMSATEIKDFIRNTCKEKKICSNYKNVLRSCATAGDIDRCVSIQMNNEDTSFCSFDGSVSYVDKKTMPNDLSCFLNQFSQKPKQ
jgi:hypothetical protein